MSDFLDHLLAQVRPGAATALEPRTPSRFEPVRMAEDGGPESVAAIEPVVAAPAAAPVPELSPLRRSQRARVERPAVQEPAVAPRPAPAEARIAPLEAEGPPRRRPLPAEPAADAPVPREAGAAQPANSAPGRAPAL